MHIQIKKGLDIPIKGSPAGHLLPYLAGVDGQQPKNPLQIALDLKPFQDLRMRVLVKKGDNVKIGQPLAEDKDVPGRYFVSPAGGVVADVRRGHKRVLEDIIIDVADKEEEVIFTTIDPKQISKDRLIELLMEAGLFTAIRTRPFSLLADPFKKPRAIFVKGLESAPFAPAMELQLQGLEKELIVGLELLSILTDGKVHFVCREESSLCDHTYPPKVNVHTASGPHPISNYSVHIQSIAPIMGIDDVVWTVHAADVAAIGHLALTGKYQTKRVVSIAGPAILKGKTGIFTIRRGYPISALIAGRVPNESTRLISGDPLMGVRVTANDYMRFGDVVFCAIPENDTREFGHFFRLGMHKYSFSKAYLSGHFDGHDGYDFTTNQHGEHRAFVDSSLYDKVMPLDVPTMLLVKAIMAEDFDLASDLGLLEVDSEDFALPTFVCPSKMEMSEIVAAGLRRYALECFAGV